MPRIHFVSPPFARKGADAMREALAGAGIELSLTKARDVLASACGYRNFAELATVTSAGASPPTDVADMIFDTAGAASRHGIPIDVLEGALAEAFVPSIRSRLRADPLFVREMDWIRRKVALLLVDAVRGRRPALLLRPLDEPRPSMDGRHPRHAPGLDLEVGARSLVRNCVASEKLPSPLAFCDVEWESRGDWLRRLHDEDILRRGGGVSPDVGFLTDVAISFQGVDGSLDYLLVVGEALGLPRPSHDARVSCTTLLLPFGGRVEVACMVSTEGIRIEAPADVLSLDFAHMVLGSRFARSGYIAHARVGDATASTGARFTDVVVHGPEDARSVFVEARARLVQPSPGSRASVVEVDRISDAYAFLSGISGGPGAFVLVVGAEILDGRLVLTVDGGTEFLGRFRRDAVRHGADWARASDRKEQPTLAEIDDTYDGLEYTLMGIAAIDDLVRTPSPLGIAFIASSVDRSVPWQTMGDETQRFRSRILRRAIDAGIVPMETRTSTRSSFEAMNGHPGDDTWHIWPLALPATNGAGANRFAKARDDVRVAISYEVGTLCPSCRTTEDACMRTTDELHELARAFTPEERAGIRHVSPYGCEACEGTGKLGSVDVVGVMGGREFDAIDKRGLPILPDLRQLVLDGRVDPVMFVRDAWSKAED